MPRRPWTPKAGRALLDCDFGPERDALELVSDDKMMTRFNASLVRLGANARSLRRREFSEAVVPGLLAVERRQPGASAGDVVGAGAWLVRELACLKVRSEARAGGGLPKEDAPSRRPTRSVRLSSMSPPPRATRLEGPEGHAAIGPY